LLAGGEEALMAEKNNRPPDEEEFDVPEDDRERGIADEEEEFEDTEEDEEEGDEEDLDLPRDLGQSRGFTSEIGSEGGSQGDLEETRRHPRVMRGSEATTTARVDERPGFDDRHAGGGVAPRRQD
jgi:hypothetical protein